MALTGEEYDKAKRSVICVGDSKLALSKEIGNFLSENKKTTTRVPAIYLESFLRGLEYTERKKGEECGRKEFCLKWLEGAKLAFEYIIRTMIGEGRSFATYITVCDRRLEELLRSLKHHKYNIEIRSLVSQTELVIEDKKSLYKAENSFIFMNRVTTYATELLFIDEKSGSACACWNRSKEKKGEGVLSVKNPSAYKAIQGQYQSFASHFQTTLTFPPPLKEEPEPLLIEKKEAAEETKSNEFTNDPA
jgi:hypothetical protein